MTNTSLSFSCLLSTPDYPYYGWGTSDNDVTVMRTILPPGKTSSGTITQEERMVEATKLTDWGQMPPSFDFLLGSHIHLGSITSFKDSEDSMCNLTHIVVGNSGTQVIAMSKPQEEFST